MKPIALKLSLAALIAIAGGLAPVLSQEADDKAEDADTQVNQLHKPGPEHEWLAEDKGEWALEAKSWSPFSEESTSMTGLSKVTVLWDRFVREEFTLGEGDERVQGEGHIGFDNAAKAYQSSYILSYGTGMANFTGKRSEDGTTVDFVNEHDSPGGKVRVRSVYKRTGKDTRLKEIFVKFGDQDEQQVWSIKYARKK